jgi:hypothetical protein
MSRPVRFSFPLLIYLLMFLNVWPFKPTDLTPLFHWNTKQLFLYLEAEYTDTKGVSFQPSPFIGSPHVHIKLSHVPGNCSLTRCSLTFSVPLLML